MHDRRTDYLGFRCTEGEHARMREAAEGRGLSLSTVVVEAFDRTEDEGDDFDWGAVRRWQGVYSVRGSMLNDVAHDLNSIALMTSSGGVVGSTVRAVAMDVTTGLFGVGQHDVTLGALLPALKTALAPACGWVRRDASDAIARRPRDRFVGIRVPARTSAAVRRVAEERDTTLTDAILARCVYADRMPARVDRALLESVLDEQARQQNNSDQIARALERIGAAVTETGAGNPLDDNVPYLVETTCASTRRWSSAVVEHVGPALRASRLVRDL